MGYVLGVDLGTTWTACAVGRPGGVEVVGLGDHGAEVPSVLFLREDGTFVVGEAAERRGLTAPHRLAREFKRRIGDPTPLLLAGSPYSAHALTATLLHWVVEHVTEREGTGPDRLVVTCPANWGPYKREALTHGIALADVGEAQLCTEPEAAALRYASLERLETGDVVAVYDLGGGTFDTAVLSRTPEGFRLLGSPAGIEQLGGVDFDDALFAHVLEELGPGAEDVDPDDEATATAFARLRRDCVQAKEALSQDTEAVVPVGLPGLHTSVRVLRSEFEDLVRAPVADTVRALRRALRSAQVEPEQLSAVLLAGGSSRIPLVAQTLSAELGRPVAVDAHPKHLVALGAALHGTPAAGPAPDRPAVTGTSREVAGTPRSAVPQPRPAPTAAAAAAPAAPVAAPAPPVAAPAPPAAAEARRPGPTTGAPSPLLLGAVVGALALLAVAALGLPGGSTELGVVRLDGRTVEVRQGPAEGQPAVRRDAAGALEVTGDGGVTEVVGTLRVLGVLRSGDRADVGDQLDFGGSASLLPGRARAELELQRDGTAVGRTSFVAAPSGPALTTVPTVASLVLLLFCGAYAESLVRPVRRGRRAGPAALVGAAALGAGAGLALAVLGWALGEHLLLGRLVLACAALGAVAAACGMRLLALRTRARAG